MIKLCIFLTTNGCFYILIFFPQIFHWVFYIIQCTRQPFFQPFNRNIRHIFKLLSVLLLRLYVMFYIQYWLWNCIRIFKIWKRIRKSQISTFHYLIKFFFTVLLDCLYIKCRKKYICLKSNCTFIKCSISKMNSIFEF